MVRYFPKRFKGTDLNYWGAYKELLLARIGQNIDKNKKSESRYQKAERAFMDQLKPRALDAGEDSYIIKSERDFAELVARLREKGYNDPEKLSVLKFYALLDYIEESNRKQKEEMNKQKAKRKSKSRRSRARR